MKSIVAALFSLTLLAACGTDVPKVGDACTNPSNGTTAVCESSSSRTIYECKDGKYAQRTCCSDPCSSGNMSMFVECKSDAQPGGDACVRDCR